MINLYQAMDRIRLRFGAKAIRHAVSLTPGDAASKQKLLYRELRDEDEL